LRQVYQIDSLGGGLKPLVQTGNFTDFIHADNIILVIDACAIM